MITTIKTTKGSRQVISTQQVPGGKWSSRLWLNNGDTVGHTAATHKTQRGAIRWAERVLAAY